MHGLAVELDRIVAKAVREGGWQDDMEVVCWLQAVAQTAMRYHYGDDGVAEFNKLEDMQTERGWRE